MLSRFISAAKIVRPTFYNARHFAAIAKSTPGHLPPLNEETVPGRYAGVLFKIASQHEVLDKVAADMELLNGVAKESETVNNFLVNASSSRTEQNAVLETIYPNLNQITIQF